MFKASFTLMMTEEFENGVFTLKTQQMLPASALPEKFENGTLTRELSTRTAAGREHFAC